MELGIVSKSRFKKMIVKPHSLHFVLLLPSLNTHKVFDTLWDHDKEFNDNDKELNFRYLNTPN